MTINLPDVALSSGGDFKKFWEIFDERLDLCYRALMLRHKRLEGTLSDAAPILWQYGALARLKKAKRSTSCSTAATPRFPLAMQVCTNVSNT